MSHRTRNGTVGGLAALGLIVVAGGLLTTAAAPRPADSSAGSQPSAGSPSSASAAAVATPASTALPPDQWRRPGQVVEPVDRTTVLAEAEEFDTRGGAWRPARWGENLYCATFANSFLSRKAFLAAPSHQAGGEATVTVRVPAAGRYLAMVRYEAAWRFETRFTLRVRQAGKVVLERAYGARANLKIWPFRERLKAEVAWSWGAGENVVWEGHDAEVDLAEGTAELVLSAPAQEGDAAPRNVDLVMLTSDIAGVRNRIEKENYLPLDGLLTQAGDLWIRVVHRGPAEGAGVAVTAHPCTEHSPYWVHLRTWKPFTINAPAGGASEWTDAGGLLDTLNDGQWRLSVAPTAAGGGPAGKANTSKPAPRKTGAAPEKARPDTTKPAAGDPAAAKPAEAPGLCDIEFAVRGTDGQRVPLRTLAGVRAGTVDLCFDADVRRSRRLRTPIEVLTEYVAVLRDTPVVGPAPKRTLVFGYTFQHRPGEPDYNALVDEFIRLSGATALRGGTVDADGEAGRRAGYVDLRSVPTAKLDEHCRALTAKVPGDRMAVVSLGDEIGLARPRADDHEGFRAWCRNEGLTPEAVRPGAGDDWAKVTYDPDRKRAGDQPETYLHSRRYAYDVGFAQLKQRTDILRRHFPAAGIGANFSPHHGTMYMGDVHQWMLLFRAGAMTQPWGEDYIFQVPVGSPQMGTLMVDMYRAAVRGRDDAEIHFYVMPHTPNNTPAAWRRQWWADVGAGVRVFNLFEFRPVWAAYTENHSSDPAMYREVRRTMHELAAVEDVIQTGRPVAGKASLWFSGLSDIWDDQAGSFGAAKRSLHLAMRHEGMTPECVLPGDALGGVLVLTDRHVATADAKRIAEWVEAGGRLVATAGAGMRDEHDRPNAVMAGLLGVTEKDLRLADEPVIFEKQHLPFAKPVAEIDLPADGALTAARVPAYGAVAVIAAADGTRVVSRFTDGSPALTSRTAGKGTAECWAYLPGLSWIAPGMPRRPFDRGARADSLTHHMPTTFQRRAVERLVADASRERGPVTTSVSTVEGRLLRSATAGAVVTLVNWSGEPARKVGVLVEGLAPAPEGKPLRATTASGVPVTLTPGPAGAVMLELDVAVAEAVVIR